MTITYMYFAVIGQLCSYAREWAKTLAREDRFGHRPDGRYGENIYCMWSSDPQQNVTAKDACQSWYKEIKDFTFGAEPRVLKSGISLTTSSFW